MLKRKTMTNLEIYSYADALMSAFQKDMILPVKVNFYLQKNMTKLAEMGQEIEKARMDIVRKYGEESEDGQSYTVPADKVELANKELSDLFALEQEVKVNMISLDAFDHIDLTNAQVAAIAFMIDDSEEEE